DEPLPSRFLRRGSYELVRFLTGAFAYGQKHEFTQRRMSQTSPVTPGALAERRPAGMPPGRRRRVLPMLLPYLWEYRGRVAIALACLVAAKLANVGVPLALKEIVDALDPTRATVAVPFALLVAYGLLRL